MTVEQRELEYVGRLLDRVTTLHSQGLSEAGPKHVALIEDNPDSKLVCGVFSYQRRAIGVPGRRLIGELTTQPVLALKERSNFTPLAYPEDVIAHPMSENIQYTLKCIAGTGL